MLINLIAAMCHNNGIGVEGKLPWEIKAELQHFSKLTRGRGDNAIVMGHTTWTGLDGVCLPGRDNFILTSTASKQKFHKITKDGHLIKTFASMKSLLDFCILMDYAEVWICGGAHVYKQFLDINNIDKCYITYIDKAFECDAFFPVMDFTRWKEVDKRQEYDVNYDCHIYYCVYEKTKL
jgi:dihydrofolate reductase